MLGYCLTRNNIVRVIGRGEIVREEVKVTREKEEGTEGRAEGEVRTDRINYSFRGGEVLGG